MTDDPQGRTVDQLIQDHLDRADLAEEAKDLIIAAQRGGTALKQPILSTEDAEPSDRGGHHTCAASR